MLMSFLKVRLETNEKIKELSSPFLANSPGEREELIANYKEFFVNSASDAGLPELAAFIKKLKFSYDPMCHATTLKQIQCNTEELKLLQRLDPEFQATVYENYRSHSLDSIARGTTLNSHEATTTYSLQSLEGGFISDVYVHALAFRGLEPGLKGNIRLASLLSHEICHCLMFFEGHWLNGTRLNAGNIMRMVGLPIEELRQTLQAIDEQSCWNIQFRSHDLYISRWQSQKLRQTFKSYPALKELLIEYR